VASRHYRLGPWKVTTVIENGVMDRVSSLAAAEALQAIEAGRASWTWQLWGQPLLSSDRGRWALSVLSRFFGPGYLHRPDGRPPIGLFDQAIAPQYGQDGVERVVELAARLAVLQAQDGVESLAAEAAAEVQPSYLAHLQALLAVAAPLATTGWALDLHPVVRSPGRRSSQLPTPDLRATRDDVSFSIEVKCLGDDDHLQETERFTDRLPLRKIDLEAQIGRGLDVTCAAICSDEEVDEWATAVRAAAAQNESHVPGPGSGSTQIRSVRGGMGTLTGPMLTNDLWGRMALAIVRATRQLQREPRGWALIQDNGSLAWGTQWSRKPLALKLNDLVAPVRRELIRTSLAGVVITTGTRNDAGPGPSEDVPGAGCVALRRPLPGRRSRETFIICPTPLEGTGSGLSKRLPAPDARALSITRMPTKISGSQRSSSRSAAQPTRAN
jgi:hypothetical protein